jgi:hypothetical protein
VIGLPAPQTGRKGSPLPCDQGPPRPHLVHHPVHAADQPQPQLGDRRADAAEPRHRRRRRRRCRGARHAQLLPPAVTVLAIAITVFSLSLFLVVPVAAAAPRREVDLLRQVLQVVLHLGRERGDLLRPVGRLDGAHDVRRGRSHGGAEAGREAPEPADAGGQRGGGGARGTGLLPAGRAGRVACEARGAVGCVCSRKLLQRRVSRLRCTATRPSRITSSPVISSILRCLLRGLLQACEEV